MDNNICRVGTVKYFHFAVVNHMSSYSEEYAIVYSLITC